MNITLALRTLDCLLKDQTVGDVKGAVGAIEPLL